MKPRLSRRSFLLATAASTVAFTACRTRPWAGPAQGKSPLNILLVTADDMGPHMGCMGEKAVPTPNLDALAASGARFNHAWVTQSSCAPSRGSMFTGMYPHENGQIGLSHLGYHLDPGVVHFPSLLREAGYHMGVVGKVHTQPEESFVFDVDKRGFILPSRDVPAVAGHAREFLAGRPAGRPFFLMVNLFDPHRPYEDSDQINGVPAQPVRAEDMKPFPFLAGATSPQVLADMASYYNGVSRVDWCIGALMNLLEEHGASEDTVVVFVGDNGPPFTRGKTTCHEAGLHVPLLVKWPGAAGGVVRDELVSGVDIFPTVLEAAGIAMPAGRLDARSLRPLAEGRDVDWRDGIAAEHTTHSPYDFFPRRAWRDKRWKLIHNLMPGRENPSPAVDGCAAFAAAMKDTSPDGAHARAVHARHAHPPELELFDLEADPHEFTNLAGLPEHAGTERRLRAELLAWRERTSDPLLDPAALADLAARHDEIRERWLPVRDQGAEHWPKWEG